MITGSILFHGSVIDPERHTLTSCIGVSKIIHLEVHRFSHGRPHAICLDTRLGNLLREVTDHIPHNVTHVVQVEGFLSDPKAHISPTRGVLGEGLKPRDLACFKLLEKAWILGPE